MNRITTSSWIAIARHNRKELVVVLLAGIGLGVGLAALVLGDDSKTRHTTTPSAHVRPAQTSSKHLGPATAGLQPGREEPQVYGQSANQAEPGSTAPQHTVPILDASASTSFARLNADLPGRVELTVAPLGSGTSETLGGDTATHGWSTTKVPVLAALLRARGESLTSRQQTLAESAITQSSNESILDLFHDLEHAEGGLVDASNYMQELFRESGDEETIVATDPPPAGAVTTFGQTEWKPSNAVKFLSALARGCLLSPQGTNYVLALMQHIEPSESWGLGSARFESVAFKGGWGPEPTGAYLVRQFGIIDIGSSRAVAVAIVAFPPAGAESFQTGTEMLTHAATWLGGQLKLVSRSSVPCA